MAVFVLSAQSHTWPETSWHAKHFLLERNTKTEVCAGKYKGARQLAVMGRVTVSRGHLVQRSMLREVSHISGLPAVGKD